MCVVEVTFQTPKSVEVVEAKLQVRVVKGISECRNNCTAEERILNPAYYAAPTYPTVPDGRDDITSMLRAINSQ